MSGLLTLQSAVHLGQGQAERRTWSRYIRLELALSHPVRLHWHPTSPARLTLAISLVLFLGDLRWHPA